ncbi:glycoside hydrolase family 65 [Gracilibacillus sp. YIM 98692]|uniref:glycoside hydrolase family 65 n=1 Tax=Gracilibacillus sp. YIM 98692 TaxID=2663532 RepID=UPI001969A80A|nr:glycoside hydrolase family 65 [Gracilibacillus sp. YIM 98692]
MDRKRIVKKHHPIVTGVEKDAPLSIGNGNFGFSVDVTGLQSFPDAYETPLGTQSNWGWHHTGGKNQYTDQDISYQLYEYEDRKIKYPMKPGEHPEAFHWLRQNPHRIQLGQIGFAFFNESGDKLGIQDISQIRQELDLWNGVITSSFSVNQQPVEVITVCHPKLDLIAVQIKSSLLKSQQMKIVQDFPNPDVTHNSWDKATKLNWKHREDERTNLKHQEKDVTHNSWDKATKLNWKHREDEHTNLKHQEKQETTLERIIDEDSYIVHWHHHDGAFQRIDDHAFELIPRDTTDDFTFTVSFHSDKQQHVPFAEVLEASQKYWKEYWESGAFVSFEESTDDRADELERRVILSQFLTAVHSSGSMPPQETGFMYNSWFGKAHLEMHWWHTAHFPLWGRSQYLEKSLNWYQQILPIARQIAEKQGFSGVRWPKMVGIDGKQSPSPVAPGLIWQQPHPIMLAELLYRANPNKETLEKYQDIIFQSADFMADFASWDEARKVYVLGPPLIPAQECHKMEETSNPAYELEYWKYGLSVAQQWAERLEVKANPNWLKVAEQLIEPKHLDDVYLAHEHCADTFTEKNHDHPSMVAACGILRGSLIDPEIMRHTLWKVKEEWQWDTAWGWDFPMCAMTAARLNEPELAIDFLLMDATKNTYMVNGHNYQRPGLSAYLPGNGGLLTAIAMMVAGWDGYHSDANPGFPKNQQWNIQAEGFHRYI